MNIKDPRVHEMAHRLARLQGTTATGAVRSALEEALARELAQHVDRDAALTRLQARVAGSTAEWLTDEDLYDEEGLPR
ncbi:MAG TPA: type II toxin-antitoxin system VapB family antitoxin [Actinomycetales bacterium]|nr:type II toxin-antitoxin system VapB family antitoxin [Actinomycetales bacterium]